MKPFLVLCLGNEVLSDDAVGPVVAQKLVLEQSLSELTEVIFAPVAGFFLLDLMNERQAVLIVDSITTDVAAPGTIHFFPAGLLTPSNGLINSHQISLPTALKFGKKMGYRMPQEIDILAIEIEDNTTLSEQLTEKVAGSVDIVLEKIKFWLNLKKNELVKEKKAV